MQLCKGGQTYMLSVTLVMPQTSRPGSIASRCSYLDTAAADSCSRPMPPKVQYNVSVYTEQAFSLGEQIDHKVAYIQQHLSGVQSAPIAIIGHSIGESCTAA